MRLRTPLAVLGSAALALGILSAGTTPAATGTAGPAASAAAEPVLDTYAARHLEVVHRHGGPGHRPAGRQRRW